MLITVIHTTRFSYEREVVESVMQARLEPRSDADQRLLRFDLQVLPAARLFHYDDGFANTVHCFTVPAPHDHLVVTARSRVETRLINPFEPPTQLPTPDPVESWPYLQFDGLVCRTAEVDALADRFRPSGDDGVLAAVQDVMRYIHDGFEYQAEVTTVTSTVADVLAVRKGVCQDFAHLMLAICRAMGIPARYISGYIYSSPEHAARGDTASHAWCEAFIPGYGWRGFDPTNAVLAADSHVKVGQGRSYHDVPPTRGVYRGQAEERIEVRVETSAEEAGGR